MTLLAGGVADEGGGVADEEDDGVAELLEVAQLAHEDRVAEVEVGGGGVEAGLDAEGNAGPKWSFGEAGPEGVLAAGSVAGDDLGGALGDEVELVFYRGKRDGGGGH